MDITDQHNMKGGDELIRQRYRLLGQIDRLLEGPMIFLGFAWLVLLIIDLVKGLTAPLQMLSTSIWVIFIVDFAIKFFLAPAKLPFLKRNWLTILSLIVPAIRIVRIVRVARFFRLFRGFRLIRTLASINRTMRSLNATMRRRGFGYVVLLTVVVVFAGAAGMHAFEKEAGGLTSYADSLWWTTMLVITVGSDYWPQTSEGRVLCIIIALYGFAVFGYITATLASFFIDRDASEKSTSLAGTSDIEALKKEIVELQRLIRQNNVDNGHE